MTLEEILVVVATCVITLITTTVVSYVLNKPKKYKEEREAESAEHHAEVQKVLTLLEKFQSYTKEQFEELKETDHAQMAGLQAVIKDLLKEHYAHWVDMGYASVETKDDLEKMYQVYHNLGANGVIDSQRAKFLALPDKLPKARSKKSANIDSKENLNNE